MAKDSINDLLVAIEAVTDLQAEVLELTSFVNTLADRLERLEGRLETLETQRTQLGG